MCRGEVGGCFESRCGGHRSGREYRGACFVLVYIHCTRGKADMQYVATRMALKPSVKTRPPTPKAANESSEVKGDLAGTTEAKGKED